MGRHVALGDCSTGRIARQSLPGRIGFGGYPPPDRPPEFPRRPAKSEPTAPSHRNQARTLAPSGSGKDVMAVSAITFPKRGAEAFIRDVKCGVARYFEQTGKSMKAD